MAADSKYRRSGVILDSTSTGLNIGRQVRVTSIGFAPGKALADVLSIVDAEGGLGCDLIVLPDRVSVPCVALPPVMLPATLMVLP